MDVAAGSKPPWKTANAAAASRMAGGVGTRPGCGVMAGAGRAAISSQGGGRVGAREEGKDPANGGEEGERLILSDRRGENRRFDKRLEKTQQRLTSVFWSLIPRWQPGRGPWILPAGSPPPATPALTSEQRHQRRAPSEGAKSRFLPIF